MIQDIAGVVVLLLAVLYLGRRAYGAFARKKTGRKKTGQGCSGCGCG